MKNNINKYCIMINYLEFTKFDLINFIIDVKIYFISF